jgi:Flp pilus assembly protein TadB
MLSPRAVNVYGFVAIGAMTIMLVLYYEHVVPPRMGMILFYAAAALFAIRIVLRIALARQKKKEADQSAEEKGGEAGT